MPITQTPLRYPGGKSQLTPYIIEVLKANDLIGGAYAEPFAGGCGVACKLLVDAYVGEIAINDIDPAVYAFWASVVRHADELCELIFRTPVTMAEWHRQRDVFLRRRSRQLDLGFATLFLNRTNRSGILKGGVIGGQSQNGEYLLDCRFNKEELIRKIQRIALYRHSIKVSRLDAKEFLRDRVPKMSKWTLCNIDPPYFGKGEALYTSFYRPDDHASLAESIAKLKRQWIVTYDDVPEIRALYSKFRTVRTALTYSAQVKRSGVELLIAGPGVHLPALDSRRRAA